MWKADPVMQGKVPKSSVNGGNAGGGSGNGNGGGGTKKQAACRFCKSKGHKTKDCPNKAGTSCRLWREEGECSSGDDYVHEHKAVEKGQTDNSSGSGAHNQRVPDKPAWIKPTGAPYGWEPPGPNATSMAMTNNDVPWTPGKVHESNCRGDACKKLFNGEEDAWMGRKLPNAEQLSMPVWCPECREERSAMHSMCIELECGECDQDDSGDGVQVKRDGVLLEAADMAVVVVTAEKGVDCVGDFYRVALSAGSSRLPAHIRKPKADEECVMEGLEDSLAGLKTAQRHITDVGASGGTEADAQVAGFRVARGQEITIEPVVPMDHIMGDGRTIEHGHVDDTNEGANAEEVEEMEEARLALPLDVNLSTDTWWE